MAKKNKGGNSLIAALTPQQARREARAAARLQFRPVARQIRGEKRASRAMSRNIRVWNRQNQKLIRNQRKGSFRDQARSVNLLNQQMQRSNAADNSMLKSIQDEERRSAAVRGTAASTDPQVAFGAAHAQRRSMQDSNRATMQTQGQNIRGFLGNVSAAATQGRNAALLDEHNRRQNANADLRELKQRRGDFLVDYAAKQRQAERDFWLQKKTLGSKSDYTDAMRYVADQGVKGRKISAGANKGNKGGKKGDGKPTRKEIRRGNSYIRAALAKSGRQPKAVWNNQQAFIDMLVNRGVSPAAARRAVRGYVRRTRGWDAGTGLPPGR